MNEKTIQYYNEHAAEFCAETFQADLSKIRERFLENLKPGQKILDAGCGSGRDTAAFLKAGYQVDAFDASEEICKLAAKNTGISVRQLRFEELEGEDLYEGIWACASLLHVAAGNLPDVFMRLYRLLKRQGVIYVSFKSGDGERTKDGRYFNDMSEDKLCGLLRNAGFAVKEAFITDDVREERQDEAWVNVIAEKEDHFDKLKAVVKKLRSEDGCPWDREQTHSSLKAACIEEAAEVICGINILEATGKSDNLKEELGDLLFQVVMHAQLAEEEGLFTLDDVVRGITKKMIRRHPHVFGNVKAENSEAVIKNWDKIKAEEHTNKTDERQYLFASFDESKKLIDQAIERKEKKYFVH